MKGEILPFWVFLFVRRKYLQDFVEFFVVVPKVGLVENMVVFLVDVSIDKECFDDVKKRHIKYYTTDRASVASSFCF